MAQIATKARLRCKAKHSSCFTYTEWDASEVGSELYQADLDQAFDRLPNYTMHIQWFVPQIGWISLAEYAELVK